MGSKPKTKKLPKKAKIQIQRLYILPPLDAKEAKKLTR